MSAWLVGLIAAIYLVAGISALCEGRPGLFLFCAGCVVANLGLILMTR